jgi:pimeloyl-ACP methyl ester carboxylesterase
MPSNTIVFITGAFVSNTCWDDWKSFFQQKGYNTYAPAWPYKDATAETLRARRANNQDKQLALLTLGQVVEHYVSFIKSLPEKPIVIGHSFGGLLTQIMVNKDITAAGVAIHSVPPFGVIPYEFSFLKAGWRSLGLFTPRSKTYMMSFATWQYAFVNGMPLDQQKAAYETYTIPESKTVARGPLTKAAYVDFKKPHAPLLLTAGDQDNIMPAHLNYRNFKAYSQTNGSVTEFKLHSGRNHHVLGQPQWQEAAEEIYTWIKQKGV